jgi:hypothetical protein
MRIKKLISVSLLGQLVFVIILSVLSFAALAKAANNSNSSKWIGNVWAVNKTGLIYQWSGRSWKHIYGYATDIGVGANGTVWIIGKKPVYGGFEIYRWMGTRFVKVPGAAVRVDVGPWGTPWVVNSFGDIFRWKNKKWQHLPGKAKDISVGSKGSVWVIGANRVNGGYGIYRWNEKAQKWIRVPGGAVAISVGNKIKSIINPNPNVAKIRACRHYADIAVKQNKINVQRRCGYRGALWSSNYQNHYNWCLKVSIPQTQQRYRQRHTMLLNCHQSPTKNIFTCKNKDNQEKGCCCFKGAHTYLFNSRYIKSVSVEFDTGKRFNCHSTVSLEVKQGNRWIVLRRVKANSSRNRSEINPIRILLPVHRTINGFRISDGCVCCIDSSKIILNGNLPIKPKPAPTAAKINGTWRWFTGETVWIYKNGNCRSSRGNRGRWNIIKSGAYPVYRIVWNNGQYVDTLTLRGNTLDGHNRGGTHVWGKRY